MTNLRIVLNTYVPDDDLALLAAGLGIPMPGATKRDRVRALIITADHAGRLDALVQRLQAMHPDLPMRWQVGRLGRWHVGMLARWTLARWTLARWHVGTLAQPASCPERRARRAHVCYNTQRKLSIRVEGIVCKRTFR